MTVMLAATRKCYLCIQKMNTAIQKDTCYNKYLDICRNVACLRSRPPDST